MNDKDIRNLFAQLKNDDQFVSVEREQLSTRLSDELGFAFDVAEARYGVRDYLEYAIWQFSHAMLRPMAASVAVFLFAVTGWVSVMNASANVLPGERLYPVKVAIEQAQMALAFSPEQKAKLQVEFTSRRLEEMVSLASSEQVDNTEAVALAVSRFKQEVTTLREDLQANEQTELAKEVNLKADVYASTVAAAPVESPEIEEVQELIDQTQEQAVEVIITAHEQLADEEAAAELKVTFEKEWNRLALLHPEAAELETAQALANEGLYRRAFQVLKELSLLPLE